MDTRVRLVFVPGHPIALETLFPKAEAALTSAALVNDGILADMQDYGTLRMIERFASSHEQESIPGMMGWASHIAERLGGFPVLYRSSVMEQDRGLVSIAGQCVEELLCPSLELVALYICTRADYRAARETSRLLRARAPHLHQTLTGPYVAHFGSLLLQDCATADTAITNRLAASLGALFRELHDQVDWRSVPGLLYRTASGISRGRTTWPGESPDTTELPYWDLLGKNAPALSERFAVYPLRCSDSQASFGYRVNGNTAGRQKTVECLLGEIRFLSDTHGARLFHIHAAFADEGYLAELAGALLARDQMVLYSLGDLTTAFSDGLADLLFASGCRALGFRTPTGSQRLIEDYYGMSQRNSAMRATLRGCRSAGLYTIAHLCYPCPEDDYHTRAETELFLEACRPDGITLEVPMPTPDSHWRCRGLEFGLLFNNHEYGRWAVGASGYDVPCRMKGWRAGAIAQEQRALREAAVALGCRPDVREPAALLARAARSIMPENEFLDRLDIALTRCDTMDLAALMAHVNPDVRRAADMGVAGGRVAAVT